ncbi:hypothetical protein CO044_04510 [Candidatus Peregrinibacteria bacterium CG_4_9_14_0_2_um_filter_38_9]|nr:MAG: hypothetical protein CO044_04510 [Candidatus Peregrinibacteria bacterium CG_4_9_14_0_2_um_filter_38_9]
MRAYLTTQIYFSKHILCKKKFNRYTLAIMENFIVTFRETLEAALIVSIILGYLSKVNQPKYKKIVYYGVLAGIICSIIGAFIFIKLQGNFTGEGIETVIFLGAFNATTILLSVFVIQMIFHEVEELTESEKTTELLQNS